MMTKHTIEHESLPILKPISDGIHWEVLSDWNLVIDGKEITIPKGFISNLTSSPRWLWFYIAPATGKQRIPALVHDYLFEIKYKDMKYCNEVLYDFCIQCGLAESKAKHIYYAAKWLGVSHWGTKTVI